MSRKANDSASGSIRTSPIGCSRASRRSGGGVETVFQRDFRHDVRGRIAKLLNLVGGRRFMPSDLRHALREIEKQAR
jgi:hypothetical protein